MDIDMDIDIAVKRKRQKMREMDSTKAGLLGSFFDMPPSKGYRQVFLTEPAACL